MQTMTTPQEVAERMMRSLHESLIDNIRYASSAQLEFLAEFIKRVEISRSNDEIDEIIAEWNKRREFKRWGDEDLGVLAHLLSQKQATTKKEKKVGVDLDKVQEEAEKLLSLLKNPHPGLSAWNEFVQKCLENLNSLTSQALGK